MWQHALVRRHLPDDRGAARLTRQVDPDRHGLAYPGRDRNAHRDGVLADTTVKYRRERSQDQRRKAGSEVARGPRLGQGVGRNDEFELGATPLRCRAVRNQAQYAICRIEPDQPAAEKLALHPARIPAVLPR
jgi:hypothetical protein